MTNQNQTPEETKVERKRATRPAPRVFSDIDNYLTIPPKLIEWATGKGYKLEYLRVSSRGGVPDITNIEKMHGEGWTPLKTSEIPADIAEGMGFGENPFFDKGYVRVAGSDQIRRGEMVLAKIDLERWIARKDSYEARALQLSRQHLEEAREVFGQTRGFGTFNADSQI